MSCPQSARREQTAGAGRGPTDSFSDEHPPPNVVTDGQLRDYFARTHRGLEDVAADEIRAALTGKITRVGHRYVEFRTSAAPSVVATLRSVDDAFLLIGVLAARESTPDPLARVRSSVSTGPWKSAMAALNPGRETSQGARFTVVATSLGKAPFNGGELEQAVAGGIRDATHWLPLDDPNRREIPGGINVRVVREGPRVCWGVRLAERPLYRRSYKRENAPGSLPPPVAFALVLLSEAGPKSTILDPMCGVGTIPIEAAHLHPAQTIGFDRSPAAVTMARNNSVLAQADCEFLVADAFQPPFSNQSVDRVVCNVPWGSSTSLRGADANSTHPWRRLVEGYARTLATDGRIVVLTEAPQEFADSLIACGFRIRERRELSIYGRRPTVLVARR